MVLQGPLGGSPEVELPAGVEQVARDQEIDALKEKLAAAEAREAETNKQLAELEERLERQVALSRRSSVC
jgi:flagellar motility protein MotE (MotC chaperone)